MIRPGEILYLLSLFLALWPAAGIAQTGSVRGSVVDQTGLVLPGATVILRGAGVPRTAYVDEQGTFELAGVTPGTYTLTVSLGGFSDATVEDVVVSGTALALPPVELQLTSFGDTVVVTASRNEVRLLDAPVSISVISASTLETTAAQNYGDLLRAAPGVNVIQLSARDVQVTSRSATNTLTNTQLLLVDGRSAYLDFFGLVLWDLLPTNFDDVEQIEVVRGPASAVWGANAMTGAVNIITKSPRESVGTTVTLSGGYVDRNDGSGVGLGGGSMFGANATVTRAPSDRLSYRVSAGYFTSDAFARPTGQIRVIDDPRQPGQTVGGAFYPLDSETAAFGTGFANRGTSQPKFDVRVDQELSDATLSYAGGIAPEVTKFCGAPASSMVVMPPKRAPVSARALSTTSVSTVSRSRLALMRRLAALSAARRARSASCSAAVRSRSVIRSPPSARRLGRADAVKYVACRVYIALNRR